MSKQAETVEKPKETTLINPDNLQKPKKNLGGRPRKTPKTELEKRNQEIYTLALSYQDKVGKDNITISGMARALGFLDSRDFVERAQKGEGGARKALSLCEEKYEKLLATKAFAGASIALKQIGWKETQYIQQESKSVSVQISLNASLDDLAKVLNPVVEENVI